MSVSIWSKTLSEFCGQTASTSPTPGGGSVTMVSSTLGLALVIMALEISVSKEKDSTRATNMAIIIKEAHELLSALKNHADEDVVAFQQYMEALRLPKADETQASFRKKAMEEALVRATLSPIEAASDTLKGIELAARAVPFTSNSVISDVGAGAMMMEAGLRGVLLNVAINLPYLSDRALAEKYSTQRREFQQIAAETVGTISQTVEVRLSPSS